MGGIPKLLDVVALTDDLPERALYRGQVGTVVEVLGGDILEVEFNDDQGRTYACVPLQAAKLMTLLYQPGQVA